MGYTHYQWYNSFYTGSIIWTLDQGHDVRPISHHYFTWASGQLLSGPIYKGRIVIKSFEAMIVRVVTSNYTLKFSRSYIYQYYIGNIKLGVDTQRTGYVEIFSAM